MTDNDTNPADRDKWLATFHPTALKRRLNVLETGCNFAHYSSADVALQIIASDTLWLRKTSLMNDFSEVKYGADVLSRALTPRDDQLTAGNKLKEVCDRLDNGLFERIFGDFTKWIPALPQETYISCLSEHQNDHNQDRGRLSMWRAYGGQSGVALTFKSDVIFKKPIEAGFSFSPVEYLTEDDFVCNIYQLVLALEKNIETLKTFSLKNVERWIFNAIRFAALSVKHPGFEEEREWRIIFSPYFEESEFLTKQVQTIADIPQNIYKLRLPEGLRIPDILDRVIIGPTDHPTVLLETIGEALKDRGIQDPYDKVTASGIPLRQ